MSIVADSTEEWAAFQQIILEYLKIHERETNVDPSMLIKKSVPRILNIKAKQ